MVAVEVEVDDDDEAEDEEGDGEMVEEAALFAGGWEELGLAVGAKAGGGDDFIAAFAAVVGEAVFGFREDGSEEGDEGQGPKDERGDEETGESGADADDGAEEADEAAASEFDAADAHGDGVGLHEG